MSRQHNRTFSAVGAAAGLGCVVIWSGQAIFSRMAAAQGLSGADISILRYAVSGLAMIPLALRMRPLLRGPLSWPQSLLFALIAGIPYSTVLVGGAKYAPALHSSVVLQALTPVFTTVISVFLFAERPTRKRIAGILTLLAGTAAFGLGHASTEFDAGQWRGDLLFALAALMFASFGVFSRRWSVDPIRTTVTIAAVSLIFLPLWFVLFSSRFVSASYGAIALQAGYHGVLVSVLSIVLYLEAVRRLGPFRASLFLSIQPVLTALFGAIWLRELPSTAEVVGLAAVVMGMLVCFRPDAQLAAKNEEPSSPKSDGTGRA